nr:unnamed protein product [Callosobruchus analis]
MTELVEIPVHVNENEEPIMLIVNATDAAKIYDGDEALLHQLYQEGIALGNPNGLKTTSDTAILHPLDGEDEDISGPPPPEEEDKDPGEEKFLWPTPMVFLLLTKFEEYRPQFDAGRKPTKVSGQ